MAQQLHCHRCKQWLGESPRPVEFVGLFRDARQRERVPEPRDTRRCKACSWVNIFQEVALEPLDAPESRGSWREEIVLKRASG